MRKTLAAIIGLLGLVSVARAEPQAQVELSAGQNYSALDASVCGEIAPRIGYSARGTTTINNKTGQVSYFGLADLSLNLVDKLDLVADTQFAPGQTILPRAGLAYSFSRGDFNAYALATTKLTAPVNGETLLQLSYSPQLTDGLKLDARIENITDFAQEHQFSIQRLRAGLGMGSWKFGASADLTETGAEGKFDYNLGGYVMKNF